MNQRGETGDGWRLECRGLNVRRGSQSVLHGIDLSIGGGECVCLIGPNGSGKTTLLLALLGLLPPSAGAVTLDGRPVHRLPARVRGRFAAYVPQTIERLPAFRVWDVVASGRFPHIAPLLPLSDADRQAVDWALAQCGLQALAERPVNAISGGERQKALIAACLAQDAAVMFLDEPNTALDPAYQVELVRLLRHWHSGGRAVVVVSHDLQLPAVLGGRVVALRGGQVVADGLTDDVLDPTRLREIYGTEFERAVGDSGRRFVLPRWKTD